MAINERDFKIILPLTSQKIIDDTSIAMSKRFGGVTQIPLVRGMWLDEKGELIKDDNILLFSSRDLTGRRTPEKVLEADRKFMINLAKKVGKLTKQKTMWIEEDLVKDVMFVPTGGKVRLREVL